MNQRVLAALRRVPRPVCSYVYDRAQLRATTTRVRAALPAGTVLLYALKANSNRDVVATMASMVDGLEVASGGELGIAGAVAPGGANAFSGPAKTDEELAAAVAAQAVVHVESALEFHRLAQIAAAAGTPVRALLRVNRPEAQLSGSHRMSGEPTPFGMDQQALAEVAALAARTRAVRVGGFHLHAVSNNLDAAAHARYIVEAVRWSVATAAQLGIGLHYVNVGGGFGIDYTGDKDFDLDALRAGVAEVPALLGDTRLVVELGRYLVADGGWYAAEVLDLKRTHGRWFAVLRGGTHHFRLPAAWGYSHPCEVLPVDDWPYPFPRPEVRDTDVDVVGELCTPRDVLARGQRMARLRVGDIVVFSRTGAYGWEISHHDFLRHPHPHIEVV